MAGKRLERSRHCTVAAARVAGAASLRRGVEHHAATDRKLALLALRPLSVAFGRLRIYPCRVVYFRSAVRMGFGKGSGEPQEAPC